MMASIGARHAATVKFPVHTALARDELGAGRRPRGGRRSPVVSGEIDRVAALVESCRQFDRPPRLTPTALWIT